MIDPDTPDGSPDPSVGKGLVRAFVDAVNDHDWPRVEAIVAPGFRRHSDAGGTLHSRAQLVAFLEDEYRTFPDASEHLEAVIAEGDLVAARHLFTGTQHGPLGGHPPTGRRMRARYLAMYRVAGDRIVEAWAEWDNLAGLAQLGHAEP